MTISAIQISEKIDIEKLPSIPHTLISIMDQFNQEDPDFDQIASIIQQDPALITKVLEIANSAHFVQFKLDNFKHILVSLGLEHVKNITTTAAVQQFFSQFNCDKDNIISNFWLSSLHAAFFAKSLANLIGYPYKEEAYLGGLIHKIGQLVFISQGNETYKKHLNQQQELYSLENEEINLFGISSIHFGSRMVKQWQTKTFLSDAILYQTSPIEQLEDTDLLIKIINIAQKYSHLDHNDESAKFTFYTQVYTLLGLTQSIVEELILSIQEQVLQTASSLDIEIDQSSRSVIYQEEYSLNLAKRVKHLAIKGAVSENTVADNSGSHDNSHEVSYEDKNPTIIIENLLQNIHVIFGIKQCMHFSFHENIQSSSPNTDEESESENNDNKQFSLAKNELVCSSATIELPINIDLLRINSQSTNSLVGKAFQSQRIGSSFEQNTSKETLTISVFDQQLIRLLGTDGIVCIPLFSAKTNHYEQQSFGVLVIGVSKSRYPKLLAERKLLGDFTHSAILNLSRVSRLKVEQTKPEQTENEHENEQRNLKINQLIHEANNPLTIINNYLQVLSIKSQKTDLNIDTQIETLQGEIKRVADILLRMKDSPLENINKNESTTAGIKENSNINTIVNDLISIFDASLFQFNHIQANLDLDLDLPPAIISPNELKQVLINLIKNAVEAMESGGEIMIKTKDKIIENNKEYIQITITDSGPGMDDEKIKQLFKPIQTTKGKQHAGLGLSICKNIINQANGHIKCENSNDLGVKFTILLPSKQMPPK